jgi:hypothetical protein
MSIERELQKKESKCELCAATENLRYEVLPTKKGGIDEVSCSTCIDQIEIQATKI